MGFVLQIQGYEENVASALREVLEWSEARRSEARKSPVDPELLARDLRRHHPILAPLAKAVSNLDLDGLYEGRSLFLDIPTEKRREGEAYLDWISRQQTQHQVERDLSKRLETLRLNLENEEPEDWEVGYQESLRGITQTLREQATRVYKNVLEAVNRIPEFSTKDLLISPIFDKDHYLDAPGVYEVSVGRGSGAPTFTLFVSPTGDLEQVEDVLEGGDEEFFDTLEIQQDYFNLVNEIRTPGASSKGKWLRLYTARPTKDRDRYRSAHTVPANLFFASTFEEALGLATDLGGGEIRDVWTAQVNTRDLVKTLDTGRVKHYQTVRETPVRSMELLSEGGTPSPLRIAKKHWLQVFFP